MRTVIVRGARAAAEAPAATARETLMGGDPAWGEPATWRAIRTAGERFTARHYLRALDLDRDAAGSIVRQPEELRIYVPLLLRTLMVSGAVTLLCLLLGYPIAHLIANAPPRRARWLILLVLAPVLDLAAGADHRLDRAAPDPRGTQQRAGRPRHRAPTTAASR